jgi:hypothetical protein
MGNAGSGAGGVRGKEVAASPSNQDQPPFIFANKQHLVYNSSNDDDEPLYTNKQDNNNVSQS